MPSEEEEINIAPDTASADRVSLDHKHVPTDKSPPAIEINPLTANIIIRRAKRRDLHAISRLLTAAFWDEDAIGRFTHPKRNRFPADVRKWWLRRMRGSVSNWAHDLIVACDAESNEIKGVADWSRIGPGAKKARAKGWKWTFRHIIDRSVKVTNAAGNWLRPNRAADPAALGAYEAAMPFFAHFWEGPRADAYDLQCLGTDPACHGQGIGRLLVAWGLERADTQGLAASVVSAWGKENFYLKCGYEEVVGNVTHGKGNPLEGVKGGDIIFRDQKEVREVKSQVAEVNGSTEVLG